MNLFEIGYKLSKYEELINEVIDNDWWESYQGQADEDIIDCLDKMIELWLEYWKFDEIEKCESCFFTYQRSDFV